METQSIYDEFMIVGFDEPIYKNQFQQTQPNHFLWMVSIRKSSMFPKLPRVTWPFELCLVGFQIGHQFCRTVTGTGELCRTGESNFEEMGLVPKKATLPEN